MYISDSTLNFALRGVRANLQGVEHFTIHDLRRTTRTLLAELGTPDHIAERCLNHKLKGMAGVYNRHDYLDERRAALDTLGGHIESLESGTVWNIVPFLAAG